MILGSLYLVIIRVRIWKTSTKVLLLLGLSFGLLISYLRPVAENDQLYFIFFCGLISVSGMTLPGLSGSFLLLLLGNYELLLVESVNGLFYSIKDLISGNLTFLSNPERIRLIKIMGVFILGSIVGLVSFVNILSIILKKYYSLTISTITGFISGSIICLWPWRYLVQNNKVKYHILSSTMLKRLVLNLAQQTHS